MKMNKWDKQHLINLRLTQKQIDKIFDTAAKEAAVIGVSIHYFNSDKPFSFADYPQTKARIEKLIKELYNNLESVIVNGVRSEWTLANNKNNVLADRVFGKNKYKLTKEQERRYYNNNEKALEAFVKRKTAGIGISDRVWSYTDRFKAEIEFGIDLGLRDGTSAADMARNLKQYLKNPDKLFRRVRDEHGQLHLSKNAKAYNPGQGIYRSSHKNAMRLARTENNMAYRTADHMRWQQFDFVVGIEVRITNDISRIVDICDDLKGKYPKEFKFTGWHPQCRCFAISILKTEEEMDADRERIMNGEKPSTESVNTVKNVPDNFKKWVEKNKEQIEQAEKRGTLPYFLSDNESFYVEILKNTNDFKTTKDEQVVIKLFNEKQRGKEWFIKEDGLEKSIEFAEKHGLTDAERISVNMYSEKAYLHINEGLRNGNLTDDDRSFINVINSALDKIKPETQTVYRGVNFNYRNQNNVIDNYINALNNKEIIKEKAFISTSIDKDAANVFAKTVLFEIKSKTGRNIEKLSGFGSQESEVLFKSGTKFRVKKVVQLENGKYHIWMEEI